MHHFYTEEELQALDNTLLHLDGGVLVSKNVTLGSQNVFYPNVVIESDSDSMVTIGANNIFYPGTFIQAKNGKITIYDNNIFGPGNLTVLTQNSELSIGSDGRYANNAQIMGNTNLGDGSQVLGPITVQSCKLEGGMGYQHTIPDERGAVLKGFGLARDINLTKGHVMNGSGNFREAPIEQQSVYHPRKDKA